MEKVFALVHEISEENNKGLRGKIDALKKEIDKYKKENDKYKKENEALRKKIDKHQGWLRRCVDELGYIITTKEKVAEMDELEMDELEPDWGGLIDWEFQGVEYLLNTDTNQIFDENLVLIGEKNETLDIEFVSDEARDTHEESRDESDESDDSDTDDEDTEE